MFMRLNIIWNQFQHVKVIRKFNHVPPKCLVSCHNTSDWVIIPSLTATALDWGIWIDLPLYPHRELLWDVWPQSKHVGQFMSPFWASVSSPAKWRLFRELDKTAYLKCLEWSQMPVNVQRTYVPFIPLSYPIQRQVHHSNMTSPPSPSISHPSSRSIHWRRQVCVAQGWGLRACVLAARPLSLYDIRQGAGAHD